MLVLEESRPGVTRRAARRGARAGGGRERGAADDAARIWSRRRRRRACSGWRCRRRSEGSSSTRSRSSSRSRRCRMPTASAGWTVLIGNSTAFFAWLEPTAAKEMLGAATRRRVDQHVRPMGRARRDGGDLIIDGRWPFNSGCVHADWYQTGGRRHGRRSTGTSRRRPTRRPVRVSSRRTVPRSSTPGTRSGCAAPAATTSRSTSSASRSSTPRRRCSTEPAGRRPAVHDSGFFPLLTVLMSGFPLGVARRALDELTQLAPTKRRGASPTTDRRGPDGPVRHRPSRSCAAGRTSVRPRRRSTTRGRP